MTLNAADLYFHWEFVGDEEDPILMLPSGRTRPLLCRLDPACAEQIVQSRTDRIGATASSFTFSHGDVAQRQQMKLHAEVCFD